MFRRRIELCLRLNDDYRIKTLQDLNESDLVSSFVVNYEFSPQGVARNLS